MWLRIVSCFVICFYLTGCATIFRGSKQKVFITSNPSGAKVKADGVDMGVTPIEIKLRPKDEPVITVEKEGYKPIQIKTQSGVGAGWVILDLLSLAALIIDAATGNWYGFDNKKFSVDLNNNTVTPLD